MTAPKRALMFYTFLWIGLVLQLARAECTPTSGDSSTCKICGAIIGGASYCSQCNDSGSDPSSGAPTDGVCTADNNECSAKKDGSCTQCAQKSFMYKGRCYKDSQAPGNTMCETAQDGKCTTARVGYFVPPGADASHQSVIPCGDDAVITVKDDKKYKGVVHCAQCNTPDAASDTVTAKAATCTECVADKYLKTDSGATSCVSAEECKDGFFPTTDKSGKRVCVSCNDTSNGGINDCAKCSPRVSVAKEGPTITCTECATDNLSPLKDECMAACPAGTYANNNVCAPCHKSCASCQANDKETSCTACYPGHSLLYGVGGATGTCIKECTGEFGANCADGQCTADVGGAKYCAQCKDGYAPIDGVCTEFKSNTRNLPECSPKNGKCTKCTGNYALLSGGCYNTQTLPGKSVCKAVANSNDGKCKTCANGQTPDLATNFCPLCDSTCAECSTKNDADACTKCFPGYYKTGNKCIKCTESSNNGKKIDGVPNCLSCEAPANAGPVICYAKTDGNNTGDDDGAGGSVNKGGLSTGAITGIAVAVVVVVGGLVGFLCWWFLCRGKA
ncbi:VSP [Giardia lamblia P15]|uniref:VSP n=1 Tax=Giardia intestinalis (strain P15) TaxID=658858 RepID=E1F0N3_GIAIA|nr:VSP [Giardia lamblia P15]